jgi:hypothetical protein
MLIFANALRAAEACLAAFPSSYDECLKHRANGAGMGSGRGLVFPYRRGCAVRRGMAPPAGAFKGMISCCYQYGATDGRLSHR